MLMAGLLINSSCENNFGDINSDPSIVTKPDPKYLFTYSLNSLESYQGAEWIWENLEQLLRVSQYVASDPYELSTNINSRYSAYYGSILPNLVEIRKQIDAKADKDRYQKMRATTYIVAILHGLKVTDMNGSIPYVNAIEGRASGNYTPEYDTQKVLYDTWLAELTEAITTLTASSTNQESYGNADIFYHSDWTKWAKLANTLKLRIAVRYENQDKTKTQQIFKEVMESPAGAIVADADQFAYIDPDHNPVGGDVDYRSIRYATKSIMTFLKSTHDPRLPIYFSPNDLTPEALTNLATAGVALPSIIDPADPLIRYQGGPADWSNPATIALYKNALNAGGKLYNVMSTINKNFFAPRRNGATGTLHDYMVTSAETCFYIAEFIQKGYGTGINTNGTAEDWYKKGITSSLKTMNAIAIAAQSTTGLSATTADAEIAAYLAQDKVKFNGVNNLERIYIQQYLNFMRLPTEAFTFVRRTGYPKNNSAYYPRDAYSATTIPRRYWIDEPALGTNNANWLKAQQEQGFTPGDRSIQALNSQRLWFDKNSPAFGEGI